MLFVRKRRSEIRYFILEYKKNTTIFYYSILFFLIEKLLKTFYCIAQVVQAKRVTGYIYFLIA